MKLQLTLKEKIDMIHGASFFETGEVESQGIPSLIMSDGPMGVRHEMKKKIWEPAGETEDFVTYFPSNVALAATWNTKLALESGKSLGAEARGRGKDVILAPGINIMRTPLCGRNFEYMSEDPYLTAEIAVLFIKGIQENDVAACVKHFALNNQETRRSDINVEVDERALREIYLYAFEACVKKADVYTLMSAYNCFRGEHCSHSTLLLDEILRGEWGYQGVIISDWAAVHDTKKAAMCGLDIEMSTETNFEDYYMASPLYEAVKKKEVPEDVIDKKVEHILRLMERIKKLKANRKEGHYNAPVHRERALEVARESVVLLKNDGVLPLKRKNIKQIAVIGENAQKLHAFGGGSAEIKALYEISPLLGLHMEAGGNIKIIYAQGYTCKTANQEKLRREAVELASQCDTVVFVGGLNHDFDSEGLDRGDLRLPYGQESLILDLLKVQPDTVVTLVGGSPVEMCGFADKAKAIVQSWYAGAEGGRALGEVLFGKTNPSGKLPVTFPKRLSDSPAHCVGEYPGSDCVKYSEGLYVGYRYFDRQGIEPQFCFGHGLSYTEFSYGDLWAKMVDDSILVDLSVKNTGSIAGKEVVQIYLTKTGTEIDMPEKELKAFQKVSLKPGEEKKLHFTLDKKDMSYFEPGEMAWKLHKGRFMIQAGASSGDIRLYKEVE